MLKKSEQESGEAPDTEQPERGRTPRHEQTTEKPRPMTFEELLRDIAEGKQPSRPAPQSTQEPQYRRRERNVEEEETRDPEKVDFDGAENARILQKYEEAQSLANQRRSLEETVHVEDSAVDFKRFAAFDTKKKKKNVLQDYVKIIRDPERLKQAVVMNEILTRKF